MAYKTPGRTMVKRKRQTDGNGVTAQKDVARIYQKSFMKRYLKKKYKRKAKWWTYQLSKSLGTQVAVRNATIAGNFAAGATTQQAVASALYGITGNAATGVRNGFNDVETILDADPSANEATERVLFISGVMDITYTNTSTVQFTQEVDVYVIRFKGSKGSGPDLVTDYNSAFSAMTNVGGTQITDFSPRGVTPFDNPVASSRGYQVLKKTKYFVSAGQTFTYQHRDPRNHWLSMSEYKFAGATESWAHPKMSICLLFIVKAVTGTPIANAGSYSIGCTRKYAYKILNQNKDYATNI